jgi:hypothetical protein
LGLNVPNVLGFPGPQDIQHWLSCE